MGARVPANDQLCHGAKQIALANLNNHHRQGQHNHSAGVALAASVFNIIAVAVFPFLQRVNKHDSL